mgnify:CR=1 FL=1
MTYKIIRIDGKDDELTAQRFDKYSDAYDLLEELYGDICCSDADYGDITYYDIVENNLKFFLSFIINFTNFFMLFGFINFK